MRTPRNRRALSIHNLLSKTSPFSWRSLFAFVTITALSTFLFESRKLTSAEWIQIMQWISGFFITGETVRKFTPTNAVDQSDAGIIDTQNITSSPVNVTSTTTN